MEVNTTTGAAGTVPADPLFGAMTTIFSEPTVGLEPTTCCLQNVGGPSAGVRSVQQPSYSNKTCPSVSAALARVSGFGYIIGYMPTMSSPCCGGQSWYRQYLLGA